MEDDPEPRFRRSRTPDTYNRGTAVFTKCPPYVPLGAVDGVRELLCSFERDGSASFADFKRCWTASSLPFLLASALQSAPADSLRLALGATEDDTLRKSGKKEAGHEPSAADGSRRLCVRHLYAAAASFLPGLWSDNANSGDEIECAGEHPLVQIGALFALFCLYFCQPEHTRDYVPLTPAAWKHLLNLCDEAKKQLLSARETGAQSAAGSSNLHIGCSSVGIVALAGRAGGCTTETATATANAEKRLGSGALNLSDVRAAYVQLHTAGALSFCCAPAPLEAESFRRPDVRGAGVWGDRYNAASDEPSQRMAEAIVLSAIGEGNLLAHQLARKQARPTASLRACVSYVLTYALTRTRAQAEPLSRRAL